VIRLTEVNTAKLPTPKLSVMVKFERLSGLWNYRLSRPTGTFFYVFFQNSKKHDLLRFFELPHVFSNTAWNVLLNSLKSSTQSPSTFWWQFEHFSFLSTSTLSGLFTVNVLTYIKCVLYGVNTVLCLGFNCCIFSQDIYGYVKHLWTLASMYLVLLYYFFLSMLHPSLIVNNDFHKLLAFLKSYQLTFARIFARFLDCFYFFIFLCYCTDLKSFP